MIHGIDGSLDQTGFLRAIDKLDRTVMPQQHPFRNVGDRGAFAFRPRSYDLQQLVLLCRDAACLGRRFAEAQEASDLISQIRQFLELRDGAGTPGSLDRPHAQIVS